MITVAGTVGVSAAALSMFPIGELFPGAFTATVFVFTDMLDGQLARIKGSSGKYGAFLDSTMDRLADAAIFGGITIWFMRTDHLLAVVSLFCLAGGLCVSYVKARAEGLGLNADVGLIERPERMIIGLTSIGLSGLGIPYVLPIGMWALAAGTALTLGQRMRAVYVDARAKARQAPSPARPPSRPQPAAPSRQRQPRTRRPRPAAARGRLMGTLRDRLVSAAFGAGWSLVCRLPESWARALFEFGADVAWRRQGPGVQVLEGNLVRVLRTRAGDSLTPSEFGAELRALSRAVMRSYARYYLETFRLQIIPDERILSGMHVNMEQLDRTLEHMRGGRGVIYALPHMGDFEQAGRWVILAGAGSFVAPCRAAQAGVGVPDVPRVPPGPRHGNSADKRRPAPVRRDGAAAAGRKAGLPSWPTATCRTPASRWTSSARRRCSPPGPRPSPCRPAPR